MMELFMEGDNAFSKNVNVNVLAAPGGPHEFAIKVLMACSMVFQFVSHSLTLCPVQCILQNLVLKCAVPEYCHQHRST